MICTSLTCFALAPFLRRLEHMKEAIRQRLSHFAVDECLCACEEDRPLVCRNIVLLVRATGEVRDDATDAETIEAFNRVVRKRLFGPMIRSVSLQYIHCVAIYLCGLFPAYLDGAFGQPEMHLRVNYILELIT